MTPEIVFGAVVMAIALLALLRKLLPQRQPPCAVFTCSRCGAVTRHGHRTAAAWRSGKTRFFCHACHRKWLERRSPRQRDSYEGRSGNSGCLGVIVLLTVLPTGAWIVWTFI